MLLTWKKGSGCFGLEIQFDTVCGYCCESVIDRDGMKMDECCKTRGLDDGNLIVDLIKQNKTA